MIEILNKYSSEQIARAEDIWALIFDVDGVLTDGKIIYTENGDEIKAFNVKDGQIIKYLKQSGIIVGAITGRKSDIVKRRCEELKLDFFYQGTEKKIDKLALIKQEFSLKDDEIAYIGDDIIDLELMQAVGLSFAPRDAMSYVANKADIITEKNGGEGVVREVADFILAAKGELERVLN